MTERWAAAVMAGLAAALAGCNRPAQAHAAPPDPVVATATAGPADFVQQIVLTGEFIPFQEVDVMAKVAGFVQDMRVDMGDRVREGDLLATLEIPEMQDDLNAAQAAVQAARDNVQAAQNQIDKEQAAAQMATLSYNRLKAVLAQEPGLVPQQDVDVARSNQAEAQAQLAGAQAALQAAQERARQAEDEQARLTTMVGYSRITAPFAGVITRRYANVGSMIQAGTASSTQALPLVRLAQNDLLRLVLPVPVSATPFIHTGQAVEVEVLDPRRRLAGKVVRFAHEVQTATRTMDTEVDVPNPDLTLMPGLYAEVHLALQEHPRALSVPLDAVSGMGGATPQVMRVGADGRLESVAVQLGLQTPTRVEITAGLRSGDVVVVGRQTALRAGERVQSHPAAYEAPLPAGGK